MAEQNPTIKTKICKFWEITNNCRKGANCHYAHGKFELGSEVTQTDSQAQASDAKKPNFFKNEVPKPKIDVLCRYFAQGYCKNGSSCRFSHEKNSNNEENEQKSEKLSKNEDFYCDHDSDYHYQEEDEDYEGPRFANPAQDIGHSYGKYGFGGEEWFDYLDANGIDPNSD